MLANIETWDMQFKFLKSLVYNTKSLDIFLEGKIEEERELMWKEEPKILVLDIETWWRDLTLRSSVIRFEFRKSTYATFDHISELEGDRKSQDTSLGDYYMR